MLERKKDPGHGLSGARVVWLNGVRLNPEAEEPVGKRVGVEWLEGDGQAKRRNGDSPILWASR